MLPVNKIDFLLLCAVCNYIKYTSDSSEYPVMWLFGILMHSVTDCEQPTAESDQAAVYNLR